MFSDRNTDWPGPSTRHTIYPLRGEPSGIFYENCFIEREWLLDICVPFHLEEIVEMMTFHTDKQKINVHSFSLNIKCKWRKVWPFTPRHKGPPVSWQNVNGMG